jgi:hypothetical protein
VVERVRSQRRLGRLRKVNKASPRRPGRGEVQVGFSSVGPCAPLQPNNVT